MSDNTAAMEVTRDEFKAAVKAVPNYTTKEVSSATMFGIQYFRPGEVRPFATAYSSNPIAIAGVYRSFGLMIHYLLERPATRE